MEQDWLPVQATEYLNRKQSLLGNGNARTTNIVVVVRIRVHYLDWPARRCTRPTHPTDAMGT
jgi:hypothetical protein